MSATPIGNFNGQRPMIDPIVSYDKAQEVVTKHEILDSERK